MYYFKHTLYPNLEAMLYKRCSCVDTSYSSSGMIYDNLSVELFTTAVPSSNKVQAAILSTS